MDQRGAVDRVAEARQTIEAVASGVGPAELEVEFGRLLPVGGGRDTEALLDAVRTSSDIDLNRPVPGGSRASQAGHRLVRRVIRWYVHSVTDQVASHTTSVAGALALLDRRLRHVEGAIQDLAGDMDTTPAGLTSEAAMAPHPKASPDDSAVWQPWALAAFAPVKGRVLVADAGYSDALGVLDSHGSDAYGVEPDLASWVAGEQSGLEVRHGDVIAHLGLVPDGALGGILLAGCTERLAPPVLVTLAGLAARTLAPGGPLFLVSRHPGHLAPNVSPVAADLAPGRPLHPESWSFLLAGRGFTRIQVEYPGQEAKPLALLDDPSGDFRIVDDNFRTLDRVLFPPRWFAISAYRP